MDIFFWRLYIYLVLLKTIHTFFCLLSFYKTLKASSGNAGPGALLDFMSLNFTLWSLKLRMKFKFGLWNCSIPENCSYHSSKVRPKGPGRIRHSSAISLFFFFLFLSAVPLPRKARSWGVETDVGLILIARENHSLMKAHVSLPSLCALTDCGIWDRPLAVWPCKGKEEICMLCLRLGRGWWAVTNPGLALQVLLCRIPYVSKARGGGAGSRNTPLAGHCVGLHDFLGLPLRDAQESDMVRERTGIHILAT